MEELPELVTQARFAGEIAYMARDLIAEVLEVPDNSFDLTVPELDDREILSNARRAT
jgi:hypothetical protein